MQSTKESPASMRRDVMAIVSRLSLDTVAVYFWLTRTTSKIPLATATLWSMYQNVASADAEKGFGLCSLPNKKRKSEDTKRQRSQLPNVTMTPIYLLFELLSRSLFVSSMFFSLFIPHTNGHLICVSRSALSNQTLMDPARGSFWARTSPSRTHSLI